MPKLPALRRRTQSRPRRKGRSRRRTIGRIVLIALSAFAAYYLACVAGLVLLRWVDPWTTGVQTQRRVESWFGSVEYVKRQRTVPLGTIPLHFRHAVIAAEDGAFYDHHGVDWAELRKVMAESAEDRGRLRGASTITQQLVKNLFFTTHANPFRKLAEYALTPVAETVLDKDRILEVYLNVIEWGPGVYGAAAAAEYHYKRPVEQINRGQAARLAACIPAPRSRRPERMDSYSSIILERMRGRGW